MTHDLVHTLPRLRSEHYNASARDVRLLTDSLMILRVAPDVALQYEPGQYTTLGLGSWEPRHDRIAHAGAELAPKLIRRAYSISNPLLVDGRLVTSDELDFVEFYITLIERGSDHPAMLTPRLFALRPGDRLHIGTKARGHYTLGTIHPEDDVLFLATGTGEAPHNAMIAKLLHDGHQGNVSAVTCTRYRHDLAYLDTHRQLEQLYPNYHYVCLTTREPENIDPQHPQFVGKRYLQGWFMGERLTHDFGRLDPAKSHVFLCGNPDMIGLPRHGPDGELIFPESHGMAELLVEAGFKLDEPGKPGTIHFEKYW